MVGTKLDHALEVRQRLGMSPRADQGDGQILAGFDEVGVLGEEALEGRGRERELASAAVGLAEVGEIPRVFGADFDRPLEASTRLFVAPRLEQNHAQPEERPVVPRVARHDLAKERLGLLRLPAAVQSDGALEEGFGDSGGLQS